jgi:hypothetical protein
MICQVCNHAEATQRHHKFPQYRRHRKHYGKILDEPFNILYVCVDCHVSHGRIPIEFIWSEFIFRAMATAQGYVLPGPMKSFKEGI